MTITAQFLSQCTEAQINKGVAWIEASKCEAGTGDGNFDMRLTVSQEIESKIDRAGLWISPAAFLPCTNPSDAWPIMMDNHIRVFPRNSEPFAKSRTCKLPVYAKGGNSGLLRAAMEVYILMSVSK